MPGRWTSRGVSAQWQGSPTWRPYQYNGWLLGALCVLAVGALSLIWILPQTTKPQGEATPLVAVALVTYLLVVLCILALDWRGFVTLRGAVKWGEMSWPARIGVALFYAVLWALVLSMPILYLIIAVKDTVAARQSSPPATKLKTAELEAELGIMPPTEGKCAHCHKPLQVGAEFCEFCGAPKAPHPLVCPHCATVTLPGASFCPNCRARL